MFLICQGSGVLLRFSVSVPESDRLECRTDRNKKHNFRESPAKTKQPKLSAASRLVSSGAVKIRIIILPTILQRHWPTAAACGSKVHLVLLLSVGLHSSCPKLDSHWHGISGIALKLPCLNVCFAPGTKTRLLKLIQPWLCPPAIHLTLPSVQISTRAEFSWLFTLKIKVWSGRHSLSPAASSLKPNFD